MATGGPAILGERRAQSALLLLALAAGMVLGMAVLGVRPFAYAGIAGLGALLVCAAFFLAPLYVVYISVVLAALLNVEQLPTLLQFGNAEVKPTDLVYLLLLLRVILERRPLPYVRRLLGADVGKMVVAVFVVLGLSTIYVGLGHTGSADLAAASLLRYVQSASIGLLLPLIIPADERRVIVWVTALALLSVFLVWSTAFYSSFQGVKFELNPYLFSSRSSSFVEVNVLGLLSALLIVTACARWATGHAFSSLLALLFLVSGLAGLFFSRSQGGHLAAALGFTGVVLVASRKASPGWRGLLVAALVPAVLAGAWLSINALRPGNIQQGLGQESGSVGQRLVSARIAFESLKSRPIFGTGWQTSKYLLETDPGILRRTSEDIPWERFYVVAPGEMPYSPANVYSQLLVETGIVGFLVIVGFFLGVAILYVRLAWRTGWFLAVLGMGWTIGILLVFTSDGLWGGGALQGLFWGTVGLYVWCLERLRAARHDASAA